MSTASVPHTGFQEFSPAEMLRRARGFREEMWRRRSIRRFSDRSVPKKLIEECLRAAASAPSGANLQPWHFVAVANPAVKRRIRLAAEAEEREFYERRAPKARLEALAPLGTDARKPFLEIAPWLIALFVKTYGVAAGGKRFKQYYAVESVGIAAGILVTAIHHAGLACLTHTPSPMNFLNDIMHRPANERPFLLLVVGYPADDATVPDITRKPLAEVTTFS